MIGEDDSETADAEAKEANQNSSDNKEWNFVRQLKKQWKEEESKDENI